ncbi:MAG: hypothetical protein JKX95_02330 [Bacteroidia bacterium]|nr:hypothetical protein [Bacteroidia bacterium]
MFKHKSTLQILLVFFSIIFLVTNCKQDPQFKDLQINDIIYTDIFPDTTITSIDSLAYNNNWFCYFPYPSVSSKSFYIDLDKDNVDDYEVVISYAYYEMSMSDPCTNNSFSIHIETLSDDSIAIGDPSILIEGDTINNSFRYYKYLYFFANHPLGASYLIKPKPSTDFYIGLKLKDNKKFYYGWLNLDVNGYTFYHILSPETFEHSVTIKGYAINKAPNTPILAGQTNN